MKYCRWVNLANDRYYLAHIKRDLLSDWIVLVCWGRKNTNLGRLKSIFCETEKNAVEYLKKINRDRVRHGYVLSVNEGFMRDVEVLEILKDELPKCFIRGNGKLPLALGIHKSVLDHLENDHRFDSLTLKQAIGLYCKGTKYLSSIIVNGPRIDIEGKLVSTVTQAEQDYAQKILNGRKKLQCKKLLMRDKA